MAGIDKQSAMAALHSTEQQCRKKKQATAITTTTSNDSSVQVGIQETRYMIMTHSGWCYSSSCKLGYSGYTISNNEQQLQHGFAQNIAPYRQTQQGFYQ
jgi:hypothetical protein